MLGIVFYIFLGLITLAFYRMYDDDIDDYDIIRNHFTTITSRKRFKIILRFIVFILWPIFSVIGLILFVFWLISLIFELLLLLFVEDYD